MKIRNSPGWKWFMKFGKEEEISGTGFTDDDGGVMEIVGCLHDYELDDLVDV
jgi:hypothetical protein